jgi:hypothetical protein
MGGFTPINRRAGSRDSLSGVSARSRDRAIIGRGLKLSHGKSVAGFIVLGRYLLTAFRTNFWVIIHVTDFIPGMTTRFTMPFY